MDTTNTCPADKPPAGSARLWARAAMLIASLLRLIGSPAQLIRTGDTTRRERREIGFMLAPIEALVRSLLMSDAIAWLTGTEEGAEMLRNARRSADQPAPESVRVCVASAAPTCPPDDPLTEQNDPAEIHDIAGSRFTSLELAKYLAPACLRFGPYEVVRSFIVSDSRPAADDSPPRAVRCPPPNLQLARRIEALRLIIADPRAAMLALARDLATRNLGLLYVPSPRNWIDERWPDGRGDVYEARSLSWARFIDFEQSRKHIDMLALPRPEPG